MELEHTQGSYPTIQVMEPVKQGGKPQDLEDEVKTQAGTMQTLSMDNVGGPSGDFHHSFDKVPSMYDQGSHDDFGDSNEHRSSIEELSSHGNTEPSLEKLKGEVNKATENVKEQAQKFVDIASQKVSDFKDKFGSQSTGFKAEVNPAKDLDQEIKDQIELVNEEIHHQPHPDEQIIESQGQSLSQKSGGDQSKGLGGKVSSKAEGLKQSSQKMVDQASSSFQQLKGDLQSQGQNLKGQAQQLLGQAAGKAGEIKTKLTSKLPGQEVNPMKDLTQDMKEQHEKVNEEIQHIPHPDEEVFESQGQSDIQGGSAPAKTEAIKAQAQEWTDKAVKQAGSLQAQGTQGLESFKDSARGALKKASQKIDEAKSKVSSQISGLGQEVNPSKDLSPDMKEQLEKVNEEIHHQPHPDEEIFESQGKKQESSKGKNFQDLSKKLEQGKETLKSQTQELKKQAQQWTDKAAQKAEEFKGKASAKEGEISKEIADKIEDLAHMLEAQQHPHHELSTESASFQPSRGGKQKLQISQDFLKPEHPEHHLTVSSPSFRPNKKSHSAMEEFEELEAQKLSQQQGHLEVPEQHEHHQLSTESPSFQSGLESKVLVEAVREALIDDSVPLIAKVEEAEEHLKEEQSHRKPNDKPEEDESDEKFWQEEWKVLQDRKEGKQRDSPTNNETQKERVPLLDAVTQGVQGVSDSITHKIQNVKEGILGTKNPEATEEQSGPSENQDRVPLIDVVAQNISDSISHKIESVKDVLRYRKVEESEEEEKATKVKEETVKESRPSETPMEYVPQSSPQTEEERVPLVDMLSQGAHNLSENITKKVQDVKQNVLGDSESYVSQDQGRVPLLDVVTQKVEDVKGTLHLKKTEEGEKMGQEKSEMNENLIKIESPSDAQIDQERVPMIDTVNQGLQNISNSIAQKVQKVKDTLHLKKTEVEEGEEQTSNIKEEGSKSKFGLFAKLTNKITGIKNKFMASKEQPEDDIETLDDKENMRS